MIEIGDKILVVVVGPHGRGLAEATVVRVKFPDHSIGFAAAGDRERFFTAANEGVFWCHGHDRESPEAVALLVAATLR